MLCFDKLKIITSNQYLKDIDDNIFQTISLNGIIQYHKYQQKIPSSLLIIISKH